MVARLTDGGATAKKKTNALSTAVKAAQTAVAGVQAAQAAPKPKAAPAPVSFAAAPDSAPAVSYTASQVPAAAAVAPAPQVVAPPAPTAPSFKDWLNSDGSTAAGKAGVDQNLSTQLAGMLADRNAYQRDNTSDLDQINKEAPETFEGVAGDFGARGLLQSSLYDKADDQAYQGVQTQRQDLQSALSDYLTNYDNSVTQRKTQAETDKRNLEAQAMQRYTQSFAGFNGFDTTT